MSSLYKRTVFTLLFFGANFVGASINELNAQRLPTIPMLAPPQVAVPRGSHGFQDAVVSEYQDIEALRRAMKEQPTIEERVSKLLEEFGPNARYGITDHFIVIYDTTDYFASWCALVCERVEETYRHFTRRLGVGWVELSEPMPVILFTNKEDFTSYATKNLPGFASSTNKAVGFYSSGSNRTAFYDLTQTERNKTDEVDKKKSLEKVATEILSQPQGKEALSTIVHEATHQVSYNHGLFNRSGASPTWAVEGLAMLFEAPVGDVKDGGWKVTSDFAPNLRRIAEFQSYAREARETAPLRKIVAKEKISTDSRGDYPLSWALFSYLYKKYPSRLAEYLYYNACQDRQTYTVTERINEFETFFTSDWDRLYSEVCAFVNELEANPESFMTMEPVEQMKKVKKKTSKKNRKNDEEKSQEEDETKDVADPELDAEEAKYEEMYPKGEYSNSPKVPLVELANQKAFNEFVKEHKYAVVKFGADWCKWCDILRPYLKRMHGFFQTPKVAFAEIDSDENDALSKKLGISGLPHTILYADGKIYAEVNGCKPSLIFQSVEAMINGKSASNEEDTSKKEEKTNNKTQRKDDAKKSSKTASVDNKKNNAKKEDVTSSDATNSKVETEPEGTSVGAKNDSKESNDALTPKPSEKKPELAQTVAIEGVDMNGKKFDSSALKDKYIILNFWATWNEQSVKEQELLAELHEKYGDRGLVIVGYSLDDDVETLKKRVASYPISWTVLSRQLSYDSNDKNSVDLSKKFRAYMLPSSIIVDREGRRVGSVLRGEKLRDKINELFSEK